MFHIKAFIMLQHQVLNVYNDGGARAGLDLMNDEALDQNWPQVRQALLVPKAQQLSMWDEKIPG